MYARKAFSPAYLHPSARPDARQYHRRAESLTSPSLCLEPKKVRTEGIGIQDRILDSQGLFHCRSLRMKYISASFKNCGINPESRPPKDWPKKSSPGRTSVPIHVIFWLHTVPTTSKAVNLNMVSISMVLPSLFCTISSNLDICLWMRGSDSLILDCENAWLSSLLR